MSVNALYVCVYLFLILVLISIPPLFSFHHPAVHSSYGLLNGFAVCCFGLCHMGNCFYGQRKPQKFKSDHIALYLGESILPDVGSAFLTPEALDLSYGTFTFRDLPSVA